jgi:endonuclease/exonuclease/phosphatase family metal-dependent hydrolase
MNKRLQQAAGRFPDSSARFARVSVCLGWVIATGGCASNHPAPLHIEHPVAQASASIKPPASLKLVTYNIWGLPSWMTGASPGRYPMIARELERLDPDLILLQEAWTTRAKGAAPSKAHLAVAHAAGQHTFFQQSGLVTVSRFPIIGGQFYPFTHAAFPDRFVNKGVLKITVELPDGRLLNVWNVHLQDGGPTAIRLSQVRELVSRVEAAEDGQIADVVGGDFNCTPGSPMYSELAGALGPSLQQLSGAAPFVTWDGLSAKTGAGKTLDHIFVRGSRTFPTVYTAARVAFSAPTLKERLSDHLGIEAVLDFSPLPNMASAPELLTAFYDKHGAGRLEHKELSYQASHSATIGEDLK